MKISLYPQQEECIIKKKKLPKSLINIWCGGGKTRIIVYSIFDDGKQVNVIVFPSLGLINQFNNDYILCEDFIDYFKEYQCLSVCSDSESKLKIKTDIIRYTTKESIIKSYLKKDGKKLFTVTYQSLEMFMDIIVESGTTINRLYYDESHHILGHNIQNIVFKNDELNALIEKTEFYTATPDNKNGITMYDKENPENSDCGPIAYEFLFYQAVEDKISKDFTMKLMLYPKTKEDMYINLFESIFRECFSGDYDYWNILTFHNMVEEKDDMATVNQLSKKEKLFKKCFLKVIEEFPEKKSIYSVENVILKGVGSKTKKREDIIADFDKQEKGRIYLLASCKTLGEGIDTKYANMEIPINPGGSVIYEQQKLGRITRNPGGNNPNGIVLIPCWIDMEKYEGLDAVKRDEMIRQELHEGGNFNTFLNVMSAYKNQCDPELWELCLKYPKMYSPKEIKDNLDKQGFKIDESKGDLIENVNHIVGEDISDLVGETDEETIQNIVSTGKQVEIHSQDKDLPIITYGSETDEEPIRLFKDEKDVYHPVSKKEPSEPKRKIERPDKLKRKKLVNVHMNDEIKVLWKIDESSFDSIDGAFCHGVLDADIDYNEEKWDMKYELLKDYVYKYNKLPVNRYITDCGTKLSVWIGVQRRNYKYNNINQDKIKLLNEIPNWIWDVFEERWMFNYNLLKEYMNNNNDKIPINNYITECGTKLGNWVSRQRIDYKNNKLDIEKIKLLNENSNWIWDIDEEQWNSKYKLLIDYVNHYKKLPSKSNMDGKYNRLGDWVNTQKQYKKNNKLDYSKIILLEKIKGWKWSESSPKKLDSWIDYYDILKKYVDKNNKLPVQSDIINGINIGSWVNKQRQIYKNNKLDKQKIKLLEGLGEYWFWTIENKLDYQWYSSYNELKEYIDKHSNYPSSRKESKLGIWPTRQRKLYKEKKLHIEKIKLLEKLPNWSWNIDLDELWDNNYDIVLKYGKKYNTLPPRGYKEKEIDIGSWLKTQRQEYKNNTLSQERVISMEKIPGWYWKKDYFQQWIDKYNLLVIYQEKYGKLPPQNQVINEKCELVENGINIGNWKSVQIQYKKKGKLSQEKIDLLEKIKDWKWEIDNDNWKINYEILKKYNGVPHINYITDDGFKLGDWVGRQRLNYNKLPQEQINMLEKIPSWYWNNNNKTKKDMSKKEIKPKSKKETTKQKRERTKSEISILHQKYKTMNSQTLHKHFEDNPDDWENYHKISEENEETFPDEEIPYKKIIEYLENIPGKKTKDVADLGCGKARVCEHFSGSKRFNFTNMDHVSCNDLVVKKDIKDTGLDDYSMDIVVLSLSMWGSNCKEYITESNRILDENGVLLIIEATKRWTDEETGENKLVKLLEDNNFTIKNIEANKFMFIECIKK
jgi:superfamily II DNA or RNA helicase